MHTIGNNVPHTVLPRQTISKENYKQQIFQINCLSNSFAKSFDFAPRQFTKPSSFVYIRQRSLNETHSRVHCADENNCLEEDENENHNSLKIFFWPEGTNDYGYGFEQFDVEDQADKGKSW